jgi:hypothetical protein
MSMHDRNSKSRCVDERRRVSDLAAVEQQKSAHGIVDGTSAARTPPPALTPRVPAALASPWPPVILTPPASSCLWQPPTTGHAHATNPYTRRRKKLPDDTNKKMERRGYLSRRGGGGHGSTAVQVVCSIRGVGGALERRRELVA